MYLETIDFLSSCGYPQYEISNFALPGYSCRHNLKYWTRHPVHGFGLGSHSFDGTARYANKSQINGYLESVDAGISPINWREPVGIVQGIQETFFLGLRLNEGLDLTKLKESYGVEAISKYTEHFGDLSDRGLMVWDDDRIKLTSSGMLLSNEIFQLFV
jgi:oxygen-independent coproporphyrinogen-3 oxidase